MIGSFATIANSTDPDRDPDPEPQRGTSGGEQLGSEPPFDNATERRADEPR